MTRNEPSQRLAWWPEREASRWLAWEDAYLASLMAETLGRQTQPTRVLEVGLWKGAWSHTLLMNQENLSVIAIDPYPGLESVRLECLATTKRLGLESRLELFPNWESFRDAERPDDFVMVHIDGEHSEQAVLEDLANAARILTTSGVIVVDDWTHWMFPGVISATMQFMNTQEWRIIFLTSAKCYLARKESAMEIQTLIKRRADAEGELRIREYWGDGDPLEVTYIQSTLVMGQPVLLCDALPAQRDPGLSIMRKTLDNWLPPIVRRFLQNIRGSSRR